MLALRVDKCAAWQCTCSCARQLINHCCLLTPTNGAFDVGPPQHGMRNTTSALLGLGLHPPSHTHLNMITPSGLKDSHGCREISTISSVVSERSRKPGCLIASSRYERWYLRVGQPEPEAHQHDGQVQRKACLQCTAHNHSFNCFLT